TLTASRDPLIKGPEPSPDDGIEPLTNRAEPPAEELGSPGDGQLWPTQSRAESFNHCHSDNQSARLIRVTSLSRRFASSCSQSSISPVVSHCSEFHASDALTSVIVSTGRRPPHLTSRVLPKSKLRLALGVSPIFCVSPSARFAASASVVAICF